MGLSSIKCDGLLYAENGEARFGKGARSASDFSGKDLLKAGALVLAGTLAAGCIDREPLPPDVKYSYDATNQEPIGAGKITGERTNGYEMLSARDDLGTLDTPSRIAIVPFKNDDTVNFCKIVYRDDAAGADRLTTYLLTCAKPVNNDSIEIGDRVAIYEANEVK